MPEINPKEKGVVDVYFLLPISVAFAALNSITLNKAKLIDRNAVYRYNLIAAAVWCVCLFIACKGQLPDDTSTWIWGGVYGITQALFILFKTEAMNSGSVSVTTLIGNCSLLISSVVCLILWHEPISVADVIGVLLLLSGVLLITHKNSDGKFSRKWLIYTFFFLIFGAAVGIIFKAFGKISSSDAGSMMLAASVVMLLFYFIFFIATRENSVPKSERGSTEDKRFVLLALISGLFSCMYDRLNIYLAGNIDAVIFFPAFNGGVIILSALLSVMLLREKLSMKQIFGLLSGAVGICIIGIL